MKMRHILTLAIALTIAICSAQSYTRQSTAAEREAWYAQHVEMTKQSKFKNLDWQFLGPTNISGRMTNVAVVAPKGENYTIYVAGATGGVWRTKNEGVTWEPIFEHAMSTAIGEVTIAPSNQDIVWIGTGEANIFRSSHAGAGVYKSMDGGDTWEHKGLTNTNTIPRIAIHPKDPNIVYIASSGHEWTDNEERGLYKTTDGGESWEKVFYIDASTGVIDLVMHPKNPNILYAATWQRVRRKWNDPRVEEGYHKSAIYKTTNAGKTWTEVTTGLNAAEHRGRIGIDICKSQPNTLYAFVDNYEVLRMPEEGQLNSYGNPAGPIIKGATVYRTDDGAANWRQVSEENQYMERLSNTYGWVFGQIRVDPVNPEKIYVMGLALHMSEDGGKSFIPLRGMHGDHHGLWIDPENTDYLVNVNDGGIAISYDGKNFRTFYDDFPLVQFFNIAYDMGEPFKLYGSVQDHGSFSAEIDLSRGRDNIPAEEWERAPGGEGTRHNIDPTDPNTVYASSFYGRLMRANLATNETENILPDPEEGELPFRGQWLAATIISPHNPQVLYHGMNFLFRSMNKGNTWERISPDLSYNKPEKYGDIPYQTIFAIAESPFKFGTLYVGTDDGRIHLTEDHGAHWNELTANVPVHQWVSKIVASQHTDGTVYLTQNGKRDDDFKAYIWKTTNKGQTWSSIVGNIPCGPVNAITEDPKNPDVLYVGTDLGVYVTFDGGASWDVLPANIPTSYFHDVAVHPREDLLFAASEGRGVYALNVRYLQDLTSEVMAQSLYTFPYTPARIRRGWRQPAVHAAMSFWLGKESEVLLTIKNAEGVTVHSKTFMGDQGFNRATWDLTTPRPDGARGRDVVDRGEYTVTIKVDGTSNEDQLIIN